MQAMASIVGGGNFLGPLKVEIDADVRKSRRADRPVLSCRDDRPAAAAAAQRDADQLVPRFFSDQLHKAAGEHAKKVWLETDHFFTGVDRYAVLETVIDFMQENLPAPAKVSAQ